MILQIDRDQAQPLHKQIIDKIKSLIDQGALIPGSRLPSSRRLLVGGLNEAEICEGIPAGIF
jgi:DNA-binding transcriptional regulator YhcF (GntR family)